MRTKFGLDVLRREMRRVDAALSAPVDVYLIGGCAMSLLGLKRATKDVDLVLPNRKPLKALDAAFRSAGYNPSKELDEVYRRMDAAVIFSKGGGPQWDIFVRRVCRALALSPGIMGRAERVEPDLSRLRVHRAASPDIFILKSITERAADQEDMDALFAAGLDWDDVLSEMRWQSRHSKVAWSNLFLDAMEAFETRGNRVPILPDLRELRDRDLAEHFIIQDVLDGQDPMVRFEKTDPEDVGFARQVLEGLVRDGTLARESHSYRVVEVPWRGYESRSGQAT